MNRSSVLSIILLFLSTLFSLGGCASKGTFTPLFDGRTLDGWEVKAGPVDIWHAEKSVIHCEGSGHPFGWLATKRTYRDFILTCEWKISENGNSGVFCRVADDPEQNPAYDSIEIQVCDDNGPDYLSMQPSELSGGIYAVAGASKRMFLGAGKWNRYVITCIGPRITVEYNGETVVDVDARDHTKPFRWFNRMRRPLMSRPREGFIAFQTHGAPVWFRNIGIREIDSRKRR